MLGRRMLGRLFMFHRWTSSVGARSSALGGAVAEAVNHTYSISVRTLQGIGQIITLTRSAKELGGPILIGNNIVNSGVILPESQNYPLMDRSIYEVLSDPCDIQYSITGTWALMIGFAAGLPPLWHVESGKSGVGVFSLMDLGANNGQGIVPAPPDAWTRIYAGWENPVEIQLFNEVKLESNKPGQIGKIYINRNEYFLIENRNNWIQEDVSLDSLRNKNKIWSESYNDSIPGHFFDVLTQELNEDSQIIISDETGVILGFDNYDYILYPMSKTASESPVLVTVTGRQILLVSRITQYSYD